MSPQLRHGRPPHPSLPHPPAAVTCSTSCALRSAAYYRPQAPTKNVGTEQALRSQQAAKAHIVELTAPAKDDPTITRRPHRTTIVQLPDCSAPMKGQAKITKLNGSMSVKVAELRDILTEVEAGVPSFDRNKHPKYIFCFCDFREAVVEYTVATPNRNRCVVRLRARSGPSGQHLMHSPSHIPHASFFLL